MNPDPLVAYNSGSNPMSSSPQYELASRLEYILAIRGIPASDVDYALGHRHAEDSSQGLITITAKLPDGKTIKVRARSVEGGPMLVVSVWIAS